MRRLGCGMAIAGLLAMFLAESSFAQRAIREDDVDIVGTVKSIQPLFQVTTDKDEVWNLGWSNNIVPNEDIHVVGEAEPTWLQSGMMVRLTAKINTKKGRFLEPITSLDVVAPRPEIEPGLIDENKPKETDDLFNTDAKKPPPKKNKPTKLPEEMMATLVGKIGSYKEGEISIAVPGFKAVKGELDPKCKITVDIALPAAIRVGDKVTIKGGYYADNAPKPGGAGIASIRKIDVTASEKFEPAKPLKRGQKPYDNAKPGEEAKDDKPEAGKPAAGKAPPAKPDAGKPPADPKKKP